MNNITEKTLGYIGGKAEGLLRLEKAGFDVPQWFVITEKETEPLDDTVNKLIQDIEAGPYAVRSSAMGEDGKNASFAGQFETYLNVDAKDVVARIQDVRTSAEKKSVNAYVSHLSKENPTSIAVVVQKMINADAAGVAFSKDPVSGRDEVIISAVRGLGEALVSGEENGETIRVEQKLDEIFRNSDGEKPEVLSQSLIIEIAKAARHAELAFGEPQDIEWAIKDGHLYLLQARPITTIKKDEESILWDNANIAESYGGLVSPLTFSFASYGYATAYRQMLKILRVPKDRITREQKALENMLGLVNGRMYYNIGNWYRLLALLPGFKINRKFMEQMMGMDDGLPQSMIEEIESSGKNGKIQDGIAGITMLGALIKEQLRLKNSVEEFHAWFGETMRSGTSLENTDADSLKKEYANIDNRLSTNWNAPLINDFLTMIWFGMLKSMCQKWCDDSDGTLQNTLVAGGAAMVSAEPANLISVMADIVREQKARNDAHYKQDALNALKETYIEKFGDRCESELKLESIPLSIDPRPLDAAIERTALMPIKPKSTASEERTLKAEIRVKKSIKNPLKQKMFHMVLNNARTCILNREEMRLERTRLFGKIRKIFVALGHIMKKNELIENERDIFWLEIDEAFTAAQNNVNKEDIISERKATYTRYEKIAVPPNRVFTKNGKVVAQASLSEGKNNDNSEVRQGIGCCAGIVRGIVKVVRDPNEEFEAGCILVTERTDPSWVMLFPAASGILVERGSLLSHAAIVSRELDIPSVVGIKGLMEWLRSGDTVEFDGATGTIKRITKSQEKNMTTV